VFISSISALATACLIRFLVGALFEMHRSRTGIKKIKKNYGFWQKLLMQPAWKECLHAKTFCRFLIVCHHTRIILWVVILVFAVISNWVPDLLRIGGYGSVVVFLLMDIPLWVMDLVLDKYPLRRMKHEYRFQKYHNSKDHDTLL
jgi:hypothetical protein